MSLSKPSIGDTGWNVQVDALIDQYNAVENATVAAVIVSTGAEARPSATVVVWSSPNGTTPTNATATDLVFVPSSGGTLTNTVLPSISGTASMAQTLTASTGTWNATPDSYTYQWKRAGSAISGATASTYVVVAADVGQAITVTVTAVKAGWVSGSATSSSVTPSAGTFTNTSLPTITGTETEGQTLTAGNGTWSQTPDSYTYQWKRAGSAISGATAATYLLVTADVGSTITVTVTAVKAGYTSVSATSNATGTIGAAGGALFTDTFNRANGTVGNGWLDPNGTATAQIVSNAVSLSGWGGYGRFAQPSLPKAVSVRVTFSSALSQYQGIFLGYTAGSNHGVKLFANGGQWVVGDAQSFDTNNTSVTPPGGAITTLRLDLDSSGNVTAYINGTSVLATTLTALGITLDTASGSVYQAGYCGEATISIDNFEVWAA